MFTRFLSVAVMVGALLALVGPLAPHACAGLMNFNNSADNYAGSPVAVTGVSVAFYDGNGPTPTRHLSNYDAEITRLEFASDVIVPSVYVSLADNYSTGGNGTGWIYGYDGDTQVWSQSVAWIGNQPPSEDDWWRQALTQVTAGAGKPIDNIRLYNPGGTPDQWLRVDNMTVDVVPEPGTLLLLVTGLLGLLAYAWRKRK